MHPKEEKTKPYAPQAVQKPIITKTTLTETKEDKTALLMKKKCQDEREIAPRSKVIVNMRLIIQKHAGKGPNLHLSTSSRQRPLSFYCENSISHLYSRT